LASTVPSRAASPGGVILVAAALLLAACGGGPRPRPAKEAPPPRGVAAGKVERGLATWYGGRFHGRKTASGERFNQHAMTAAHKTLPMGTRVRVTNQRTGRSVVVRINDRGPYAKGRIIDVSRAAAEVLGMVRAGVVPVTVEVLSLPARKKR
jgi:rare lipoprotein A